MEKKHLLVQKEEHFSEKVIEREWGKAGVDTGERQDPMIAHY